MTNNVVHTEWKVGRQLHFKDSELLRPDKFNYKPWCLKVSEYLNYGGLWCQIEPVKPELGDDGKAVDVKEAICNEGGQAICQSYGYFEGIRCP